MTKPGSKKRKLKYKNKVDEESVNKGFVTDRTTSKLDEPQVVLVSDESEASKKFRKTKGTSYTRNANELKKLLLDSGI
jgi:hypothetical protein